MDKRWKNNLSRSKVTIKNFLIKKKNKEIFLFIFSAIILAEGNKYRLKLKNVELKDAGEISFQCGDLKENCKLTVKECM
jgi:hypothetical protein